MSSFLALITLTISRILYGAFSEYCKHKNELMVQVLWGGTKNILKYGSMVAILGGTYVWFSYVMVEVFMWYFPKISFELIMMYFAVSLLVVIEVLQAL